ncbi:MAG: PAS domain S-box protein [Promethearchaeota archaeon]|nr:MAG: PAS domain S-box protein [Candidatus Lokiarchaeota archaeon]
MFNIIKILLSDKLKKVGPSIYLNDMKRDIELSGKDFRSLYNALPNASYVWKKIEGDLILIAYNAAAEQITEGKVKNLIGIKASELYKDRPKIIDDFNECLAKKAKISRETIHKFLTTGKVKNLVRFYDFIEPDLVFVQTEDITKQKQVEESLKKEEQEKSLILQAVSDHIIYYDMDQTIIWANRAASDSLNVPNEKIIGRKCYELWHNRKEPCDRCPVIRAKETGMTQTEEMETPDGRVWMVLGFLVRDGKGELLGMVEITRDITERKQMEKALKEDEQFLQNFFDAIQDGVSILDRDLTIIKVNPWMERMYVSKSPLVGKKCYEAYQNRTSICPWCPSIKTIESGEMHNQIVPYPSAENPVGWIDLSAFPLKDENGSVVNIIEYVKDITKQKNAEQKLKESEEKFRKIAEQSFMGIGIIQDDQVKYVNEVVAEILEYSVEEMMNWTKSFNITNIIHPEDLTRLREQRELRRAGEFNLKPYISYRIISRSGKVKWIDQYSKNILYQGKEAELITITDITEKKIAEKKLKDSEEKYRDIAELLPDTIFEADLEMNLNYVNSTGYTMFRYSPQDLENGVNLAQLLTPDSLKKAKERVKAISEGISAQPNEYELVKKDGTKIHCRVHSRPIIKDGKIIGFRGTVTDINDIKLAEQALKERNLELSVLNRIISLGNESQSLREFLEKSYDQILDILSFDRGGVYLYNSETEHNVLFLHKNVHPNFIAAVEDIDISKGVFNKIFDRNKTFYVEDFSEFMPYSKELGVHSVAIIPLRSKDKYLGSLNIGSSVHQVLSDIELELLLAIGKQMGIIIQKFESEKLLKESEEKYRRAYNRINLYKDLFTHDINNIFQNILSSNELAMLYSNIPDKLQDFVEVANLIKEQVARGAKLVSNVQKLSELEEFEKPLYSIEVCSVLTHVFDSIKRDFLHKKIKINFFSLENKFLVKANELIFDIFENILINAVKHNRNRIIEIQIKMSKEIINNRNLIKLEFIDNGIGIPDSMKNIIFQRDYRKGKASGIGLGLLLIKRILESYEGSVEVKDKIPGEHSKGSNFIVIIPEA